MLHIIHIENRNDLPKEKKKLLFQKKAKKAAKNIDLQSEKVVKLQWNTHSEQQDRVSKHLSKSSSLK